MTAIYVRRLFDQHAASFDESLTARLSYSGPQLLLDAVTRACGVASRPLRFATMLDLGCGTGLAGGKFRAQVQNLVGIDLSSAMIEQARVKNIYDRLEAVELTEFLAAEATRGAKVDLVVAADVFVYISDLAPVAAAVALALARDGLFAFTVETHEGDGVLLQPTLRYAHSASHVRDALEGAGLAPLLLEPASPRTEKGLPVNGLVAVAAPKIRSAVP
jgi:predicted TPR repeat methyltransferase